MLHWLTNGSASRRRNNLVSLPCIVGVLLAGSVTLLQQAPLQAASAPTMLTSPVPSSLQPSQNLVAFSQEKQQLSDEYISALHGKEPLVQYENHYLAFMQKWNLGKTDNLHTALTTTRKQAVMAKAGISPNSCPSFTKSQTTTTVLPLVTCPPPPTPVSAVQFPEVFPNYCGHATISTILVEDSFKWPNTNSYPLYTKTYTIRYPPYQVSQPTVSATVDEDMLAGEVIFQLGNLAPRDSNTNPNDIAAGTNPPQVTDVLNRFVQGRGGYYVAQNDTSKFQNNLITDANQGWELAVGMTILANKTPVLFGWPTVDHDRSHWLTASFYSNAGATTEIADPVANASIFFQNHGYAVSAIPPHENIDTIQLMSQSFVSIW